MWLPETAVDLPTLQLMAEAGIRHTILAPWQVRRPPRHPPAVPGRARRRASPRRRPVRRGAVGVGLVRSIGDGRRRSLRPRAAAASVPGRSAARRRAAAGPDRDRRRAVRPPPAVPGALPAPARPTATGRVGARLRRRLVRRRPGRSRARASVPIVRVVERTSWSCHHGVLRWSRRVCLCRRTRPGRHRCGPPSSGWPPASTPARNGSPASCPEGPTRGLRATPTSTSSSERRPRRRSPSAGWANVLRRATQETFLAIMESQRRRLAMFASDAWFWDDPVRPETMGVLRAAAWAARRMDGLAGSGLERRLIADLAMVRSAGPPRSTAPRSTGARSSRWANRFREIRSGPRPARREPERMELGEEG